MKTKPAWISDIEWEVDQIRDQIYEETKDMTTEQLEARANEICDWARARGMIVISSVQEYKRAKEEQTNGTR